MSNYIYKTYDAINPLVDLIHKYIQSAEIIHMYETTTKVIELNKKKNEEYAAQNGREKCYVWLMTAGSSYKPAFYYQLGHGRNNDVALNMIGEGNKYIHSDYYSAYGSLKNITNVYCFAHVKRKFKVIHDITKNIKDTGTEKCLFLAEKVYLREHEAKKLANACDNYYESLKETRNKLVKPALDEFYSFVEEESLKVL